MVEIFTGIAAGIPWTLALTAMSFAIGAVLGLGLCGLRVSRVALLRFVAAAVILTFRSIPPIVWLFLIFFGIGTDYVAVGPFTAAAVGLGLVTAANMAEIYRGALSAVHLLHADPSPGGAPLCRDLHPGHAGGCGVRTPSRAPRDVTANRGAIAAHPNT